MLKPSAATILAFYSSSLASTTEWAGWGANPHNNRWASTNTHFTSQTISTLSPYCQIQYPVGVSATPVTHNSTVFYPTWNGLLVALDYTSCETKWSTNITSIILEFGAEIKDEAIRAGELIQPVSRTSPQIDSRNGIIYIGTLRFALIIALDVETGHMLGHPKNINSHPSATVAMSPTFYAGKLFVGSSSSESAAASRIPGYRCCSFIGNMVSLSFNCVLEEWTTHWDVRMIPREKSGVGKWSGAALWGSQPSVDEETGTLFIGSGNVYTMPVEVEQCLNSTRNSTTKTCISEDIWQDSILAIDIATGTVKWTRQAWSIDCNATIHPGDSDFCSRTPSIDSDFGIAPVFVPGGFEDLKTIGSQSTIIAGRKNGHIYALSASTGSLLWRAISGPGGMLGGLSWGLAVDSQQIYFNQLNSEHQPWKLASINQSQNGSAYGAVSLETGDIMWKVPAEGPGTAYGPPTVVGDIMITNGPQSGNDPGTLVVLEKSSGKTIKKVQLDAPSRGGMAVRREYLVFGTGYSGYVKNGSMHVMKIKS